MLETERLILRPARTTDAENLLLLNSDPEVLRYTGDTAFRNYADVVETIQERLIKPFEKYKMTRFMVFLKDDTFLGWCGLKFHPETNEVDLGYRFMKKHWGKGYATESSKAALRYGFETLGLKKIIAKAMPDNPSSMKVMQKLKMTFRGYKRDPTDPCSFVVYDITKEEFEKCERS